MHSILLFLSDTVVCLAIRGDTMRRRTDGLVLVPPADDDDDDDNIPYSRLRPAKKTDT